jgi:ABC-type glycerol-3-phosphate transport system substrate-binding protein
MRTPQSASSDHRHAHGARGSSERRLTRRAAALAGVATAALGTAGLAACGATGDAAQPREAAGRVSGSIEFWHWGTSYEEGFQKLADEFNAEHEGATVNRTMPAGYDDKIQVSIAADSGGPDVYMQRGPQHKQWSHDGLAVDLTAMLARDKAAAADLARMHKTFANYYHYQGKLHGVPWDFSTISVAYNVNDMRARGLAPPAELGSKWDWNTFNEYARQLTPGDGSKYGVDANPGIETGYYNWVAANGGGFFSADDKRSTAAAAPFITAAEAYTALGYRLAVSPPRAWRAERTKGLAHAAHLLSQGLVSMQTAGDWFFRWYDKTTDLEWDVVPMPYSPHTRKTASIANFRGMVIAPTSRNKDLAWAWIASLMRRGVQDRVPDLFGEVPARMDSIEGVYLDSSKAPTPRHRKLLKVAIDATHALPAHPLIPRPEFNATTAAMNEVYDGKRAAREVLAEIEQKLNALIGA